MAEALQFDATGSNLDGTDPGSPLTIMNSSYTVLTHSYASPEEEVLFASSVDTEGSRRASSKPANRTITMTIEMVDASGALLRALQAKVAKIRREGGTLKRTDAKTGAVIIFDLITAGSFDPKFDISYYSSSKVEVDLTFIAVPFGRGTAVTLSSHSETTLPYLVFTETGITGDASGLGKLIISDAQAVDQWFVMWGIQSRNYSSSANAALFYEAEGRTALGGSATAAGPSGASGAGSNVMRNTALSTNYQAILSTQATGAGAHLSHVGDFRVFARVQVPTTNTGTVTIAWEWAEGDFRRWTRNAEYTINAAREGTWVLADLGQVHPSLVAQGTQRWEGRVIAKSTVASDDIDVDCIFLPPVTEGYGEASAVPQVATPTAFSARDEFDQTAGAATGKTLPAGGAWTALSGTGATDFNIGSGVLTRTATNLTTRVITAGSTNYTTIAARVDVMTDDASKSDALGLVVRATDSSNLFSVQRNTNSSIFSVTKTIAGVATDTQFAAPAMASNAYQTIQLIVDSAGRWFVWWVDQGSLTSTPTGFGYDAALATGGALATGMVGIRDDCGATAQTRTWDNFAAWVPPSDAAMFASQSLEVRHDRVIREDSGGTLWQKPSRYEGDYLLVPPAGAEARTLRVFVKASRTDPAYMADAGIDDISAQLVYVPRYLVIP